MNCEHDEREIWRLKEQMKEALMVLRMSEEEKKEYRKRVMEAWREVGLLDQEK